MSAQHKGFSLKNKLDKNSIIHILEFLTRFELNNLAGLTDRFMRLEEIEKEFYNEQLLNNVEFGKCLVIYSWSDWFWKEIINTKIILINQVLKSKKYDEIKWKETEGNFRTRFIKELCKIVHPNTWKRAQKIREERKLYIRSLSDKINEISYINGSYKNRKCQKLILKRIEQKCFIEEESIQTPLQEELQLEPYKYNNHDSFKWVSMGAQGIGKTCLLIRVGYGTFPDDYVPTVFDSYSTSETVPYIKDKVELESKFNSQLWDTAGGEDYDRLRPLSYPNTILYTMEYAINDWSSLRYLAEHLLWECMEGAPTATFVVVSTKNDLKEQLYWTSIFDSYVEEPISKEDGIEFTKAIGAVSFIETSAKTGQGALKLDVRLALIRHTHIKYLDRLKNPTDNEKKKCSVQ